MEPSYNLSTFLFYQVNSVKFNEYSSVVVSAGYDRSVRAWDCRSHSTEPIQASIYDILVARHNLVNHDEVVILGLIKDDWFTCLCVCIALHEVREDLQP